MLRKNLKRGRRYILGRDTPVITEPENRFIIWKKGTRVKYKHSERKKYWHFFREHISGQEARMTIHAIHYLTPDPSDPLNTPPPSIPPTVTGFPSGGVL